MPNGLLALRRVAWRRYQQSSWHVCRQGRVDRRVSILHYLVTTDSKCNYNHFNCSNIHQYRFSLRSETRMTPLSPNTSRKESLEGCPSTVSNEHYLQGTKAQSKMPSSGDAEWEEEGDPDHEQRLQYVSVQVCLLCAATLVVVRTGLLLLPHLHSF